MFNIGATCPTSSPDWHWSMHLHPPFLPHWWPYQFCLWMHPQSQVTTSYIACQGLVRSLFPSAWDLPALPTSHTSLLHPSSRAWASCPFSLSCTKSRMANGASQGGLLASTQTTLQTSTVTLSSFSLSHVGMNMITLAIPLACCTVSKSKQTPWWQHTVLIPLFPLLAFMLGEGMVL